MEGQRGSIIGPTTECQAIGLTCRWLDEGIQAAMCWSPAVRASGDGERQLHHPANWNYRPVPDVDAVAG